MEGSLSTSMAFLPIVEVAAALIQRDGRYLITTRREGTHLAGLWEFPGGKRRPGEQIEDCLKRELKEELDIEVEVHEEFKTIEYPYPDFTVHLRFFRCSIVKGEVRPKEGQEFRWVHPSELGLYEFPPADAQLLQELLNDPGGKFR